jgi:hypothetical protein
MLASEVEQVAAGAAQFNANLVAAQLALPEAGEVVQRSVFDHNYPATRILWAPEPASREKDLLATAGDDGLVRV